MDNNQIILEKSVLEALSYEYNHLGIAFYTRIVEEIQNSKTGKILVDETFIGIMSEKLRITPEIFEEILEFSQKELKIFDNNIVF